MATDPASDLQQYIGDLVHTALEAARLGYMTDTSAGTAICTGNIMAAVYNARPAINPNPPQSQAPPWEQDDPGPRHSWSRRR